jgi:hypothetical protein
VYEAPNNVPKSFRLDIRLTYGFTDFSAICEKSPRVKRALNSPTISEIVNRGIVLAIREWEKRDKKGGLVMTEINNDKVAGTARSTNRSSSSRRAIPSSRSRSPGALSPTLNPVMFPVVLTHNF